MAESHAQTGLEHWPRSRNVPPLLALAVAAIVAGRAGGHETDHFTPPPARPWAELGPALTRMIHDKLVRAVEQTNAEIAAHRKAQGNGQPSAELRRLQSPDHLARAVCAQFGVAGFYITELDQYLRGAGFCQDYPGLLVAHWPSPCVYDRALVVPIDPRKLYILWRASVIRVNGVRVGTDKIGHFIHHGYNYYAAYREAQRQGADEAECRRRAASIATGGHLFFSERMLLGTLTSGVVSNADLAANYLGLLFYLNLTQEVRVGGVPRPPMVRLENGVWRVAEHVRRDGDFFNVFMCEHMDEALNPNLYDGLTAAVMRRVVGPWCAELRRQYVDANGEPRPAGWFRRKAEELRTYYGEDYGHCGPAATLIGIAPLCDCDGPPAASSEPAGPGETALHAAVRNGQSELVTQLLRAGADPAARTLRAATPLHLAAENEGCTAALLAVGADPHAQDALGRTPLHRAVRAGQSAVVRRLLAAGAQAAATDCDGQTPLHEAVRGGSGELVALLLGAQAAPGTAGLYGGTPLHLAAQTGRADLAGQLLNAGAQLDATDEFGRTPLHRAAAADHGQVAALLVARGANVRAADNGGTTPLHLAARSGNTGLVELLLERGADRAARTAQGRTPQAEARAAGHALVAQRLEAPAAGGARPAAVRGGRP